MKETLICGNSLDEMKKMPDKSVDCIITDPPFGIGFKYNTQKDTNNPEEYWTFFKPFFVQIKRIVRDGGFVAIWQSAKYFKNFWSWYGEDIRIYAGCKNFVQLRKTAINYGYDPIIMFYNGKPELRPEKPKRNIDFFVANTAKFVTEKNSLARKHPCPRPVDQTEIIINNFSVGTVLDPFMGSGTTGVACKKLNRNFIGIEIDQYYFDIAKERITGENPNTGGEGG